MFFTPDPLSIDLQRLQAPICRPCVTHSRGAVRGGGGRAHSRGPSKMSLLGSGSAQMAGRYKYQVRVMIRSMAGSRKRGHRLGQAAPGSAVMARARPRAVPVLLAAAASAGRAGVACAGGGRNLPKMSPARALDVSVPGGPAMSLRALATCRGLS